MNHTTTLDDAGSAAAGPATLRRSFKEQVAFYERRREEHRAAVRAALAGREIGTELNDGRGHYAVLLREMNGDPDPYRVTRFDARGFYGHTPYKSIEAAIEELASDGYLTADPGALRRLSATKEWALGIASLAYLQAWNGASWDAQRGLITRDEEEAVRKRAEQKLEAEVARIEAEWAERSPAAISTS